MTEPTSDRQAVIEECIAAIEKLKAERTGQRCDQIAAERDALKQAAPVAPPAPTRWTPEKVRETAARRDGTDAADMLRAYADLLAHAAPVSASEPTNGQLRTIEDYAAAGFLDPQLNRIRGHFDRKLAESGGPVCGAVYHADPLVTCELTRGHQRNHIGNGRNTRVQWPVSASERPPTPAMELLNKPLVERLADFVSTESLTRDKQDDILWQRYYAVLVQTLQDAAASLSARQTDSDTLNADLLIIYRVLQADDTDHNLHALEEVLDRFGVDWRKEGVE